MKKNKKNNKSKIRKDFRLELRKNREASITELKDGIREANDMAMLVDGHDNALVGWSTDGIAIYRISEIIGTLIDRDGMSREEAMEYFDFNILGAYVGEYTPIYMYEE